MESSRYGRRAWARQIRRIAIIDAIVALSASTLFGGGCLMTWRGIDRAADAIGWIAPDHARDWISGATSDAGAAKRHEWVSGAAQGRGE